MPKQISDIQKITGEQADNIIVYRLPLGRFYLIEDGVYVGIDNRDGNAWTEDFKSLDACKRWLNSD